MFGWLSSDKKTIWARGTKGRIFRFFEYFQAMQYDSCDENKSSSAGRVEPHARHKMSRRATAPGREQRRRAYAVTPDLRRIQRAGHVRVIHEMSTHNHYATHVMVNRGKLMYRCFLDIPGGFEAGADEPDER